MATIRLKENIQVIIMIKFLNGVYVVNCYCSSELCLNKVSSTENNWHNIAG